MLHLDLQGHRVPTLGFGTWRLTGKACRAGVEDALALGYRHLDTARMYGNEAEVGAGLRASGVPRADVFLTTKVWRDDLDADRLRQSAEASLRDLETDYVDLLLVHWPDDAVPLADTLGAMERLREAGAARLIGVSNFPPGLFARALATAPVACVQVEYHPFLDQSRLLALCAAHDAFLTAYTPLAKGRVLTSGVLRGIAEAHGKTPAQVALRWLVQQPRVATIPKAASAANRRANLEIFSFALTDAEMDAIFALTAEGHRVTSPPFAPDWNT